ncbi:MAG: OB-fold domain-containing protein [Nitrospirae bacterium]|nr:OB-fold domain-containing protein [Nitrospirota bacterium]
MKEQNAGYIRHRMGLAWEMSPGATFSAFHAFLEAGKLAGLRCTRCRKVYLPPRPVCGDCYMPLSEWFEVSDRGSVEGFTVSHHPILDPVTGSARPTPYASLLVRLDGASTSINHYLRGADPRTAAIGMRVRAVWREPRRTLMDLLGFEPTGGGEDAAFPRPLEAPDLKPAARVQVNLDIPFAYAVGRGGRWFCDGLRSGRILASRCGACAKTLVPCRSFCPSCFRRFAESDLREVGPGGAVAAAAGAPSPPLGLIRLDGADTLFVHHVRARRGVRVTALFKPTEERRGDPLDIEAFVPVEASA